MKELMYLKPLILFRIINALLTKSFFQADEFMQSLEPAHVKVFGYGQLTWEWQHGIRSYGFPFIFELVYYCVIFLSKLSSIIVSMAVECYHQLFIVSFPNSKLGLDMLNEMVKFPGEIETFVEYYGVWYGPKIAMAVIAAIGEFYSMLFIGKIFQRIMNKEDDKVQESESVKKIAMVLSLTNFFNCFFITRTFINSFEMALTSAALYYWDWDGGLGIKGSDFTKSLAISIFATFQRPTNIILWAVLGALLSLNLICKKNWSLLVYLYGKIILVSLPVCALSVAIDYSFYGEIRFPFVKFLEFNVLTPMANFYGKMPWHFHIVQSLPLLLGFTIPLFIHSFFLKSSRKFSPWFQDPLFQIRALFVINLILCSITTHKEFRFIYPMQPILLAFTTLDFHYWLRLYHPTDIKMSLSQLSWFFWFLPALSVFGAFMLCNFHETGTIEIMSYLHSIPSIKSVGFVMPCHSTPWQSHLHRGDIDDIWAITCEPPLHLLNSPDVGKAIDSYIDESDYLYFNTAEFFHRNFVPVSKEVPGHKLTYEWPEYLVIFEEMDKAFMHEHLKDTNYAVVKRLFNSIFHWDRRRMGDIVVYRKFPLK
ncbi:HCL098Wp [Eremothecium sinecaudum]|uniref:Mannosyltransferase n=1 Tax=Eremothecium sinecaudum TaxID=45286 RepID=A0A109UYM0_9SACH|nr:HCL098Wp [Eremothecium sinecaudum]AMD20053.1 HCL098Wp [Eremothecium sinecaudum]